VKSIVTSIAIHGLLVLLAVASLDRDSILPPPQTAIVDVVWMPSAPKPVVAPIGGDAGSPRPALATHSRVSPVTRHTAPPSGASTVASLLGPVRLDAAGNGDGGRSDGAGRGTGRGIGDGIGDAIGDDRGTEELVRMQLPAPPPASKARPARLIYPSRQTDIEEAALFVAAVTVDTDGYVVGAHLTRGFGGNRDADASSLIFRFRYEPALDDANRPIRSTVEQHFHVSR
jgi:hypothetical protein